jgi:5'-deoxynucleotidase YfbR-like HD superfamily hydrolase
MKYNLYPLELEPQYAQKARLIIKRLYQIPRTGWLDRKVKNPETVGEHSDELVKLAEELFEIPGLSLMLKIHDWPEKYKKIGDRRTDALCSEEKRWTKERKYREEKKAMQKICAQLGPIGPEIMKLWLEYSARETPRGQIAYQLDKFQRTRKAIAYQKMGEPVVAKEFFGDVNIITNEKLKALLLAEIAAL